MKPKVNGQISAIIRKRNYIFHFINNYDIALVPFRWIYLNLLYGICVLKNHIFKINIIITYTICFRHIYLKLLRKRKTYNIRIFLVNYSILHICYNYRSLFESWRSGIIYPMCFLKNIKRFPRLIKKF